MEDVIIIGGGFAGLAAALQLGRARRNAVVLDTGLPRNRFAAHAHGVLGHDGRAPGEILDLAREQIRRYSTIRIVKQGAAAASGIEGGFEVTLDGGAKMSARRLVLAYGMADDVPDIPGAKECWGKSLLHCPYCHGFEVADRRLGGMVAPERLADIARLYLDWSRDLTMFTNGVEPPSEDAEKLKALGVKIVTAPVLELEHEGGQLTAVVTTGGRVPLDALFGPPPVRFTSPIGESLGCATKPGFLGPFLACNERQQTSVPGVYAGGDITHAMHSVTFAIAGGAAAGTYAHQSLLSEPPT